MSSPVLKIVRPGYDVLSADPQDFALNTEYLLPKIYMQKTLTSDIDLTNDLGYPHGSWAFRRLTSSSFYRKDSPLAGPYSPFQPYNWFAGDIYNEIFTGDEYTYFSPTSTETGYVTGGVIVDSDDVKVDVLAGDTSLSIVLFAESLTSSSSDIQLPTRPYIKIGVEGEDLGETNLSEQRMNTKLDTLKIFKTGTLTLSLPTETLTYKSDSVVHTATVAHGLDYPPMYFPPRTVSTGFKGQESTDVYVDDTNLYLRVIRCSVGDDSFGMPGGDSNFTSETVSLDYTIFYNDITEEFNLLT